MEYLISDNSFKQLFTLITLLFYFTFQGMIRVTVTSHLTEIDFWYRLCYKYIYIYIYIYIINIYIYICIYTCVCIYVCVYIYYIYLYLLYLLYVYANVHIYINIYMIYRILQFHLPFTRLGLFSHMDGFK